MNADDMKRVLERSLHEGGMDSAPGPDRAVLAERVRGARRRRAAASAVAGVASLALVAAVVWQVGGFTNDPNPPATPTPSTVTDGPTTEPSSDPTDDPTETSSDDDPTETSSDDPTQGETDADGETPAGIVLHDFSDAVFGECGQPFTPTGRASELVVENGPTGSVAQFGGSWTGQITNNGQELVQAPVGYDTVVLVDSDGLVVATPDPDSEAFFGYEGSSWFAVAPGESLDATFLLPGTCATGDWLPAGDYQAYGAVTFVGEDGVYEQAQGGPWPLTIGSDEGPPVERIVPTGTLPTDLTCGASLPDASPTTGFGLELLDQIRTPRAANDPIDGRAVLSVTQQIDAALFLEAVVLQDGVVVAHVPGHDNVTRVAATPGTSVPLTFESQFLDCATSLDAGVDVPSLPSGSYQVAVVALTIADESTQLVAMTEPVDIVLE